MSLVKNIENWGVVGAGGAGFPAHVKYNAKADTVIVNAAECEPLLHKDKEILKAYPKEVIQALRQIMDLSGATRGIFGIKAKYKSVFEALEPHLLEGMEFLKMGNYYPAGDELVLVWEATGRTVAPGNIPLSVGCIVTNVETLLNVARSRPVITSWLSVGGAVVEPCSLEVKVGATVRECIDAAGGVTCEDPVLLLGGVMMGSVSENFETPVTKTMGGILVFPRNHDLIRRHVRPRKEYDKIAKASCDQCNFCTELCPRYLLGHPIEPHKNMRSMGFWTTPLDLVKGAEFCCECNLCSFYACPEDLDPKNISTNFKRMMQVKDKAERMKFEPGSVKAHPMAPFRKAPIPKLMKKLNIDQYRNEAPLKAGIVGGELVTIPLNQHVGAPAVALVKVGQKVEAGDPIGRPEGLGAWIHASISGVVTSVGDAVIVEER